MSAISYLWEKCGSLVQSGLLDDSVFEIALNPDGCLWFATKTSGYECVGSLSESQANTFVCGLAQHTNQFLNDQTPYLDAILPFRGERINVTMPPMVERVSFNIRKKSSIVFTLNDYEKLNIITPTQANYLKEAVLQRKNILISGSPAAGKTALANALLTSVAEQMPEGHRVLLLEQVPELVCAVSNVKRLLTTDTISMRTLLWVAMRNAPDRIVVGEVRDGAALEMLKAWNTGCRGGIATIHANNAKAAIQRVLDLSCEAVAQPPKRLLVEAIDVIVQINSDARHPAKRCVQEILEI